MRLRDFYRKESNYTLFNQISPNDISQGMLADSYLLAVLCAMAEQQTRIVDLFLSQRKSKFGVYGVRLFVNGEMQEVIVDDSFPYDDTPEVDHWAFAKASNDCEVYVMVL